MQLRGQLSRVAKTTGPRRFRPCCDENRGRRNAYAKPSARRTNIFVLNNLCTTDVRTSMVAVAQERLLGKRSGVPSEGSRVGTPRCSSHALRLTSARPKVFPAEYFLQRIRPAPQVDSSRDFWRFRDVQGADVRFVDRAAARRHRCPAHIPVESGRAADRTSPRAGSRGATQPLRCRASTDSAARVCLQRQSDAAAPTSRPRAMRSPNGHRVIPRTPVRRQASPGREPSGGTTNTSPSLDPRS